MFSFLKAFRRKVDVQEIYIYIYQESHVGVVFSPIQ